MSTDEIEYTPFSSATNANKVSCTPTLSTDNITDLPISNGFDSIFIVVDQGLSKGVILMPCNKTITSEETATLYIDNVFIQYGLPDVMISNRGPQFTSNIFNGIMDTLGINHRMSTAFHP